MSQVVCNDYNFLYRHIIVNGQLNKKLFLDSQVIRFPTEEELFESYRTTNFLAGFLPLRRPNSPFIPSLILIPAKVRRIDNDRHFIIVEMMTSNGYIVTIPYPFQLGERFLCLTISS